MLKLLCHLTLISNDGDDELAAKHNRYGADELARNDHSAHKKINLSSIGGGGIT